MTVHIEKIQNGYIFQEGSGPRIFVKDLVYAVSYLASAVEDCIKMERYFWDGNHTNMSGILVGTENKNLTNDN